MTPAVFSADRKYRYTLRRAWIRGDIDPTSTFIPRTVNFICLNPSTADETNDDPTVRRCIGYAKAWKFDGLTVTNIFALRSTDPAALYDVDRDPVGRDNDAWISGVAAESDLVVCAWGEHSVLYGRHDAVVKIIRDVCEPHYLKLTKAGRPGHPLYLPADLEPQPWKI